MGAALAATCSSCPVHTPPLPAINPTQTPSVSHLLVCWCMRAKVTPAVYVHIRYIMYILHVVYVPCTCGFKFLHDCIAFFSVGVMSPYAILQRNQYLSVIRYIPMFFCLVYFIVICCYRCVAVVVVVVVAIATYMCVYMPPAGSCSCCVIAWLPAGTLDQSRDSRDSSSVFDDYLSVPVRRSKLSRRAMTSL